MIHSSTRAAVIARAKGRCEYCQLPQKYYPLTFTVDHVIATQHRRDDSESNLAFACSRCNGKKGPNLSSIDPVSNTIVELFHPRRQNWVDHFQWNGPVIVGTSDIGRATVALLEMNDVDRINLRGLLIAENKLFVDETSRES